MNIEFISSDLLPIYKNITQDYLLGIALFFDSYEEAEKQLKIEIYGNSYNHYIIYHHKASNKYGFLATNDLIEPNSQNFNYLYKYYNQILIKETIIEFLKTHNKDKLLQLIDEIESESIIKDLLDEG